MMRENKSFAKDYKRFSNIRSVLNGIIKRAVSLNIIDYSPIFSIDYAPFKRRCRPESSNNDNYSKEERKHILSYLEQQDDIYSLAIQLAFHLCIRISELIALKQKDVVIDTDNSYLYIRRATRKEQAVAFENDQLHFGSVEYVTADRVKSNKREGFRHYPLTSSAIATLQKAISLNPDGEYLFMRDNNQIYGDSFNRELKRVCNALDIKYRSSHQIRFTVATMLYEDGVPINVLSYLLGHSDTNTTWRYIRRTKPTALISSQIVEILEK